MQRLTPDILHIRIVQIVSDKRETQIFHMDTDLVGASGLQDEGDEAVSVFLFHNAVMGYSPFALIEIDLTLDEGAALTTMMSSSSYIIEMGRSTGGILGELSVSRICTVRVSPPESCVRI